MQETESNMARPLTLANKKLGVPLVILTVAVIIAAALILTPPDIVSSTEELQPVTVRMIEAQPTSRRLFVRSEGTVRPRAETQLVAQVSGEVTWVSSDLVVGGEFAAGDLLLRLDQRDYEVAVIQAKAQLTRASADHSYAAAEAQRITALYDQSLASTSQLQLAQRSLTTAEAGLQQSEAQLKRAQTDLERTEIRAPFDGRVRNESVDLGQFVQKGTPVTSIYGTDAMEIRLPLSDAQLAYLEEGLTRTGSLGAHERTPVTLSAQFAGAQQTWYGELRRTEASIAERSRLIYLVAEVTDTVNDAGTQIPVGLFVHANITGRWVENVIALPRVSLRDNNTLLIIDESNRLRFRAVSILRKTEEEILVSAGLAAGERVSISPLQFVSDGMPVVIEQ